MKGLVSGTGLALNGAGLTDALAQGVAPAIVTSDKLRPQLPGGVISGDVTATSGIVWSRTDCPARMIVEYSTSESFKTFQRRIGPAALDGSNFTARVDLTGLPPGADVFYRVRFQDLVDGKAYSEPVTGAPVHGVARCEQASLLRLLRRRGRQGWGINERFGGYRIYEVMRRETPDFFIHQGDQIYADGVIESDVKLPDGTMWTNIVTEGKSHVAQTLDDYRAALAYNQLDKNKRRFAAEVPFLVQWDDYEVRNNWYPGQRIGEAEKRYQTRAIDLLEARAKQAMFEYNPYRINQLDPEQVYRGFQFGPLLDVFMLDERSYRGANSPNRQTRLDANSAFLGSQQTAWLKASLKASRATWKVIASDMPISLVVPDANPDVPKGTYEAWANADNGAPLGRELELKDILAFIKQEDIRNVVWVTADVQDVHYAQATYYDPSRAKFSDFKPFWEFVGGPINAGTFGLNDLDTTFGPDLRYVSVPKDNPQNRSPASLQQFYGRAKIDPVSRAMTVSLHDLDGKSLYEVKLDVEA